ncbi:MAG: NAD-dependent epimerase/dehydratase family protein [Planctomycetota bacterium]
MPTQSRREFIVATAAGLGALSVAGLSKRALGADAKPMKILFLGGTGFIGPHIIEHGRQRGHEFTLFNRGNRKEMFPDLELIEGNRIVDIEPGLAPLEEQVKAGRTWDAIIDTSNVHTWTEHSAKLLKGAADRYLYVSSLSVYADASKERAEGAELATMPDEVADGIDRLPYDMTYFGAVKARCEAAAERHFPGRALLVRPGLIVGPRDTSHRFNYWPLRIREGGEVLCPGDPTDPVMLIDARDLAKFIVTALEKRATGPCNVNGPTSRDLTIGRLVNACKDATESDATFTWCDAQFLAERGINGWAQMPCWLPPVGAYAGFNKVNIDKARAIGLTTRDLRETAKATLAWFDDWSQGRPAEQGWIYQPGVNAPGITRQREAEVLAEWHEHNG